MRKLVFVAVLVAALGMGALGDVTFPIVSTMDGYTIGDVSRGSSDFVVSAVSGTDEPESFVKDGHYGVPIVEGSTPSGTNYRLDVDYSGVRHWCDAEKKFWNFDDDNMCWAATASNVLYWTGWGLVDGMSNTDQMFSHFQDHWTDKAGAAYYGWNWWFDGTVTVPDSSWSSVDVGGGGNFWSTTAFNDYIGYSSDASNILSKIDGFLRAGYGIGLSIAYYSGGSRHGHAITCWGFNYDSSYSSSDPRYYKGIWVTDSDDDKGYDFILPWLGADKFPNKLKYYEVYKESGKWYLRDFSSEKWQIESASALGAGPGIPPKVDAGSDITGVLEGNRVFFDGDFRNPGKRSTHSYKWNFGDGTPVVTGTLTPSHVFYDDGVYTVTLSVTDEHGDVGTDTLKVTILDRQPTANFGWNPLAPVEGSIISFIDLSVSFPDDIVLWSWNFGDSIGTSTLQHPTYAYIEDGTYLVTLTVTDEDGSTATYTATVTVDNAAPIVDAGLDQTVDEGAIVMFSGSFWDPGLLDTHTIEWNFGDGAPIISGTLTPTHAYGDNGEYTVLLTVTDDDGGVGTNELLVTVLNVAPMITTPLTVNQPNPQFILPLVHTLTFTVGFTDPGWLDTHTVLWDFDVGTCVPGIIIEENIEPDATGSATTEYAFANPGIYTVTVMITDDDCILVWTTLQVTVVTANEALSDINQFIQTLPENAFDENPTQRKNAFNNMFLAIAKMLDNEAYRGAIEDLRHNIREKADGQVDGDPLNDWITDLEAQQEICMKIDDLIAYLEFFALES